MVSFLFSVLGGYRLFFRETYLLSILAISRDDALGEFLTTGARLGVK
jgi:hypothetical protein